ncbi:hypothetical protein L2E82_18612 [Cichorium intybus]|uniref:Uncharacterized protein n=1 Tax=Cichorium intybus TaxID=13427 RepID=A0ACB9FA12_CICIN|nr:hypothetical protein L2E82_18612 [Cichorium intybus]
MFNIFFTPKIPPSTASSPSILPPTPSSTSLLLSTSPFLSDVISVEFPPPTPCGTPAPSLYPPVILNARTILTLKATQPSTPFQVFLGWKCSIDPEILHFVKIKFTAISVSIDLEMITHFQKWKGKFGTDLALPRWSLLLKNMEKPGAR